jgi:nucleotide-binding universal stress UspA family protein
MKPMVGITLPLPASRGLDDFNPLYGGGIADPTLGPHHRTGSVLAPIIRGQAAAAILSLADTIARCRPSRGVVLGLVEIPTTWLGLATSAAERARDLLRWIAATDYQRPRTGDSRLGVQTRITSNVTRSIREAVLDFGSDLVLLEWPGVDSRRRHRLESMLQNLGGDPPTNLVLARPDPQRPGQRLSPRSVLVPVRGGPNARLALTVAAAIAADADAELSVLHVYDRNHHYERREQEAFQLQQLVRAVRPLNPEVIELTSERPVDVLLGVGRGYDAVVMGAHAHPRQPGTLIGSALASVVRRLPKTVILTRAAGPASINGH